VESFTQQLNGGGTLTAQLDLSKDPTVNAPYLEALTPRRSVLWVLADNYPIWNGIIWDWPDMTRQGGTLPISAQTIDSIFNFRIISSTLEYIQVDIFEVFVDLCRYGTTKKSSYMSSISPIKGPTSSLVGKAAHVAGLVLPAGLRAGFTWNASYLWSDLG